VLKKGELSCLSEALPKLTSLRDLKIKNIFCRSGKVFKQHL
jgi:hypothetical protein